MEAIQNRKSDSTTISQNAKQLYSQIVQINSVADVDASNATKMVGIVAQAQAVASAALKQSKAEQQQCQRVARSCMAKLLQRIPLLLPQLTARQASLILQSMSTINMPIEGDLQGLAIELTQKVATGKASATDIATVFSALAQWEVQGIGNFPLKTEHANSLRVMIKHFAHFLHRPAAKGAPTGQEAAQLVMNMEALNLRPSHDFLDATSAYMLALIQQPSSYTVEAPSIAILLNSLYSLRHLPPHNQAEHLLEQFAKLCSVSPLQKKGVQDATNVVVAAAGLGLPEVQHVVQDIGLRVISSARASSRDLCVVCRCMAMFSVLDLDSLERVLNTLHAKGSAVSGSSIPQLYHALYQLQPSPRDSQAMHAAWEGVHQRVKALGDTESVSLGQTRNKALSQALVALKVVHKVNVQFFPYTADAVLHEKLLWSGPFLLCLVTAQDALDNAPDR